MGDYLREKGGPSAASAAYYDPSPPPALADAAASTVATAMLFGSIIFATASLAARMWLTGTWERRDGGGGGEEGGGESRPLDLASLPSAYGFLRRSSAFGLILLYSYVCENHPPHFHEEKTYDRDEFFFWTILVVVVAGGRSVRKNADIERRSERRSSGTGGGGDGSASRLGRIGEEDRVRNPPTSATALPSPETEVLNRYQTEEWKGWMQFVFLLYHYMHATEVYNGIRVLITCYVWMTGYGNLSFYYATNDYSFPRVAQMLWRLNFLVFFLCLTHGNPYLLYYICPLHTYFFAMVYAVMFVGKERNYTKWWIRTKLGVLALIVFLVWDCDFGIFERLHGMFLSDEPTPGSIMGSKWEWYFRSYLDHWSALLGMVFALNFPIASLFFRKLEARSKKRRWMGKSAVAAGMLLVLCLWANGPLTYSKIPYNSTNPYFGFVPLLAYVYFRNLTPTMRSHTMDLLREIGKTTLETYLCQHHMWLTSNSKTVLVFVPGWPRVNLVVVTWAYVALSRKLHDLTLSLRGTLLPNDRGACVNSLVGAAVTIAGFYCAAFLLEGADMTSLAAVGMASTVCGGLLYQTVVDSSWPAYQKSVKKSKESTDDDNNYDAVSESERSELSMGQDDNDETIYSKLCPPLIGSMVLLVLGLTLNGFAAAGAGAIGPLPPQCDAFVNEGLWIPIDGCNEASRGMAYRDYGAVGYGTCAPHGNSFLWAWKEQPSRTRCRFGHRSEAKIKTALNRRSVAFIGDSMTRYVYHASMRAMGIADSGAYDATGPKHADISNTLWGTTPINFKWAPLAVDQLGALKEINQRASQAGIQPPDLIVLGGGAWDRLHVYATDEDRQSHTATLKELGREMQKAQESYGAAVVWFIPTTINSKALNTEEKRDHMREEDMEAMRAVYARNGILSSSSFVIDGPAFTSSRVAESYDGVHYPIQVYDAGAQILFNALDWLLPPGIEDPITPPRVGKMANPKLGVVMLVLVTIGLVCFDGFLGFSYLASLFVKGVAPHDLHEEAFSALHKKIGLASSDVLGSPPRPSAGSGGHRQLVSTHGTVVRSRVKSTPSVDEEIAALLGSSN
ncbi:hypothetical protein ACHAWF_017824 [Thalassiosira exigua]